MGVSHWAASWSVDMTYNKPCLLELNFQHCAWLLIWHVPGSIPWRFQAHRIQSEIWERYISKISWGTKFYPVWMELRKCWLLKPEEFQARICIIANISWLGFGCFSPKSYMGHLFSIWKVHRCPPGLERIDTKKAGSLMFKISKKLELLLFYFLSLSDSLWPPDVRQDSSETYSWYMKKNKIRVKNKRKKSRIWKAWIGFCPSRKYQCHVLKVILKMSSAHENKVSLSHGKELFVLCVIPLINERRQQRHLAH